MKKLSNCEPMVAKGHKITNVPFFKEMCDILFVFVTIIFELFLGTF